MNPNVGKYTYSEVKKMTIFERYELFGCLEAEDVMKSMLKESKEEAFTGPQEELVETKLFEKYGLEPPPTYPALYVPTVPCEKLNPGSPFA